MAHAIFGFVVATSLITLGSPERPMAQPGNARGVFVGPPDARLQLTVYAEPTHGRRLKMAHGVLRDTPATTPSPELRVITSMPNWQPSGLIVGTLAVFSEDNSETRTLSFGSRKLNVFAEELRSADLERADVVARLLDSVGASRDNPGYLFVVMFSSGLMRYYPVRLALEK